MSIQRRIRAAVVAAASIALLAGCTATGSEDESPSPSQQQSPPAASETPEGEGEGLSRDVDLREESPEVAASEALGIATDEVGDGTVHAVELEWSDSDGVWEWSVKVLREGEDHEVDIDANTGEILRHEQEPTDDSEQAVSLTDPMAYDESLELATRKLDGALVAWKLEWDDDRTEYQFDIVPVGAHESTEVTVNVDTGEVMTD